MPRKARSFLVVSMKPLSRPEGVVTSVRCSGGELGDCAEDTNGMRIINTLERRSRAAAWAEMPKSENVLPKGTRLFTPKKL